MTFLRKAFSLILLTITFSALGKAQILQDQIQVTTPTAPWTVSFEGKSLTLRDVKIKATEGSGYFLWIDNGNEMNVSLYIEPADACKTSDECRDYVLGLGNPAWGKYQDLAKGRVGSFSYFEFFRPEAMGQPLKMLDMYAQYVDKGYWIDLHISKVLYKKGDHVLFENLIKGIKFVPKGEKPTSGSVLDKIETASTGWLRDWDAIKCKETYSSLTSISRQGITEQQWTPYCQNVHQKLGKLQSRKLIVSTLMKSLPSKPELSGAQLGYRSVFQNATVVESVALTQEKDGRWTVSNYLAK